MSTYAVAGVTGRVGSVVARELLAHGETVRAILRDTARGSAWSTNGAQPAIGLLEDAAFLTRTLEGVDGFFVLLPEDPFAADFRGTRRRMADAIAAAVTASRVPHVVLLSARAAMLPDGNGPAKDLHYLETLLRATNATVTIVRSCWFQENVASVIPAATHGGIYPNLMLSSEIAWPTAATPDVGRVAASLLLSRPSNNEVIDVIGPSYSARDLARALGRSLGKQLQVVDIPPAARVRTLVQAGLPESFAEEVAELYGCVDAGRVRLEGDRAITVTTTIDEVLASGQQQAGMARGSPNVHGRT